MEIITRRFLLREFIDEDESAFLAYQSDSRYAEFHAPQEVGTDHARELLHRFRQWAAEQPRRNYQLAVSDIRNPWALFGCCGLRREGHDSHQAGMGIELAPNYWGRYAYAIEIASALLQFGFEKLGLAEIRGVSVSANSRVSRLARRYGFIEVAMRPNPAWMRARGWSQIEWQLTRDRWGTLSRRTLRSSQGRQSGVA
jgi:[ribosomal protein S5]-alanine N-acetyltransferase